MEMLSLDSDAWVSALVSGMGADVVSSPGITPVRLAIFSVGPFRIAYPDFPSGRHSYPPSLVTDLSKLAHDAGADVIRFHSAERVSWSGPQKSIGLGTRCISDLQIWDERSYEKARRASNRMLRSPLRIEPAVSADAPRMYEIYLRTLGRHGGNVRYPESYFRATVALTSLVARHDNVLCAFVSFARLGARACYLHGGYDPAAKSLYPSDLLFLRMICEARESGATSLDFLPSPSDQPNLLRYKESWGGQPAPFMVSDLILKRFRGAAFDIARGLGDRMPQGLVSRLLGIGRRNRTAD